MLSILLCLCMLAGMFPLTVSAASQVNIFNIAVTEPKAGEKPSLEGSVPATASTTVTKVEWSGKFASNGKFIKDEAYTVRVTCTVKPGQDKVIKYIDGKAKINTYLASHVSTSSDRQSIILEYTFENVEKSSNSSVSDANKILTASYDDVDVVTYEWTVLRLTNVERFKEGLQLLSMPQALQYACNIREQELTTLFSHDRPNGKDCYSAIGSYFKWNRVAENIAKGQQPPK